MDVVTLGESMILFMPDTLGSMRYAQNFSVKVAGAESNVAIGLARLNYKSGWISHLGDDEFGKKINSFICGEGVDVSEVRFNPSLPTGLNFKEMLSEDEIKVHYYRQGSAASYMQASDLNEEYIKQAKYLHLTGITPALSEGCYKMVLSAIEIAKRHGVTVVFDPNLRKKLWDEEHARKVILEISAKADIVLPGINEGKMLFNENDVQSIARLFYDQGSTVVVLKLGEKGAYYLSEKEQGYVPAFPVRRVLDPVGAGDGFAAGFLSGLLDQLDLESAVKRGAAVGALVTTVPGDVEGMPDRTRLESYMNREDKDNVTR